MSFFSGKAKDKDPFAKKSQFYVEFLGWMECMGLRGQRFTDPVIRELRRRQRKMETPPKLTIQVSRKDLKITQDVEEKRKRNIKKIKFPNIPARDVTFVHQATRPEDGRPDDIVACIYLGYMPRTQRFVHVHVYRFDEPSTASIFASQMAALVEDNLEHIREVEIDLANKGQIYDPRLTSSDGMSEPHTTDSAVGSASSAYSDDESPTFGSDEIDPDLVSLKDVQAFDNVADELKFRLQMKETPLLLPPKDYDTISRAHGNLEKVNQRRCLNLNVVGGLAQARERNGSSESGVEMASPGSEGGEIGGKTSAEASPSPKIAPKPAVALRDSPASSPRLLPKSRAFHENGMPSPVASHPSPGTPPLPLTDMVYPPKVTSPPMSPRLYRPVHSRQNSQNSHHSSDYDSREAPPIQHYMSGSSNDIYAMPLKGQRFIPQTDFEIPPDYQDDFDGGVQLRGGPRYHQPNLTHSMPTELIRSELNLGSGSRPNSRPGSGEIRHLRRTDSPIFVGGAHLQPGNAGMYSPRMQRLGSSHR